jgi:uroporphyrin-III C-methyltransferase/precorrin-2 dehydrogenase/sirohydrochlorin ferrochelatase
MNSAPLYPLFLDVAQRPVLIVGGGAVALRKAQGLVQSAARVTVVSPAFADGFLKLTDVERIQAAYAATHMARKMWRLVFAATDVRDVNAQVQKHAGAAGIFCCRCDEPDDGDFSNGAVERLGAVRRADGRGVAGVGNAGGVTIVVGTKGASPVVAARICRQAAAAIDPALPALVNLLAEWRDRAKRDVPDAAARRALLQRLAGEGMEAVLRADGEAGARRLFEQWLAEARAGTGGSGGASPGAAAGAPAARASHVVEHAE